MLFTVVFLVTAVLCYGLPPPDKSLGSEQVPIEAAPYQVLLFTMIDGKLIENCGGAIVTNTIALTAAHCIKPLEPVKVGVGSNLMNATTKLPIIDCKVHDNFARIDTVGGNHYLINDIAYVLVDGDLTRSPNSHIIPLADVTPAAGNIGFVTGWGGIVIDGRMVNELRGFKFPIITGGECVIDKQAIMGDNICQASKEQMIYKGDSGGPLKSMTDNTLVGIVSMYQFQLATSSYKSYFVNIGHHREWIRQNIGI